MYFTQRLCNEKPIFAKNLPYLFMAHQYVEREMLQKQMTISGLKGALGSDGRIRQLNDSFSFFQKIPGSPKFWQVKRNELTARVQQLGPFHIFFTLSCAEKRWVEVYLCVLRSMGVDKLEVVYGKDGNWNGTDNDILVNGKPFWEFLKSRKETDNDLIANYIVLVTRIFDDRVKNFMKTIVLNNGPDEPNFSYYTFRVEFQARGLPHIHGNLIHFYNDFYYVCTCICLCALLCICISFIIVALAYRSTMV